MHLGLYGLGAYRTWLAPTTVLALLLLGVLRNELILGARHVGYAWALHAAWNLTFLGGFWYRDGERLPEPAVFDLFLGRTPNFEQRRCQAPSLFKE